MSPQTGMNFSVVQFWGSNSRPKPSFRHPPCARTHSAHTKVQLYRFARRAVLGHTMATSSHGAVTSATDREKISLLSLGKKMKNGRGRVLFMLHGGECPWCNGRSLPATLSHFKTWKISALWQGCHWHVCIAHQAHHLYGHYHFHLTIRPLMCRDDPEIIYMWYIYIVPLLLHVRASSPSYIHYIINLCTLSI